MLDLAFVRANLEQVEAKLRTRGGNAADVLADFRTLDQDRRERITEAEGLKATRKKLSDEIARLRREKQDASSQMEETKRLKARIEELEGGSADEALRERMAKVPNLPYDAPFFRT